MALTIKLKPGESLILNGVFVENGDNPTEFRLLNKAPLLREKDILREADATTICRKIYFLLQWMYFDEANRLSGYQSFLKMSMEVIRAAPSTCDYLDRIQNLLLKDRYYQALKETKRLIKYEDELLSHASQPLQDLPEEQG
ncbi:MAG: flagellar biosynthesis repressor FlbT [Opitutales bacterium]|nr:flagellar biosynthesis repressor FlbT [Opitutales bacterium]